MSQAEYIEAKVKVLEYERLHWQQLLPSEEEVRSWSNQVMVGLSWSPIHYHERGAIELLRLIKDKKL